jgi:Na+/melibiose symporter-like transporter
MRRNAVLFVAISLLAGFGSTAMSLVAGIWILDLTGSSSVAGLAGLCVYAPTLAAPWLGGLVDRLPRRPLLIGVNLALTAALLTLFAVHSRDQVWLIFAVMLGYGVGYVLLDAGETALLPAALPAAALGDVNGWRSSAQEGTKLIAPLAGAAIYAWRGGASVAVLSAAMPVAVAALYALVRLRSSPTAPPAHRSLGARDALAVLWRNPAIRTPVLVAAVAIAMSGVTTPAQYAAVTDRLGLASAFMGVLASAQGAGSIAGGVVAGRLLARWGPIAVAAAGAVLFAAGSLAKCLPWGAGLVAGSVLVGIGLPWTLIAGVTALQTGAPEAILGRVAATAGTVMFGPLAVAIPIGSAAVHLGSIPPMVVAAVVCSAVAALALRHREPAATARSA